MVSLEIDTYKNGYNLMHFDCLDIPIAGAAGYYNYDSYYFYCYYYCLLSNWTNVKNGIDVSEKGWEANWISFRNSILEKLGLMIKPHIIDDTTKLIPYLQESIDKKVPLLLTIAYKHIFFSHKYMTDDMGINGILVSDYDRETSIVGVRESQMLNIISGELTQPGIKGDPLFKFLLKEEMLYDMWVKSNLEFKKYNPSLYNTVFTIEKISDPEVIDYEDLINDFIYNFDVKRSNIANIIDEFENYIDYLKNNIIDVKRNLISTFTPFFDVIEKVFFAAFQQQDIYNKYIKFKDTYQKSRNSILSILYKNAIKNKNIDEEKKNALINDINTLDNQLKMFVEELYNNNITSKQLYTINKYVFVDLDEHLNNKGFNEFSADDINADLTGKGEFFICSNIPQEQIWEVNDMKFKFPLISQGLYDNVSCERQLVSIPEGYYNSILILGCGEWGSQIQDIELIYENQEIDKLTIALPDWAYSPTYGGLVAWSGPAAIRTSNGIKLHNFTASLFIRKYLLKHNKKLIGFKLPDCPNMHIFAIALTQ